MPHNSWGIFRSPNATTVIGQRGSLRSKTPDQLPCPIIVLTCIALFHTVNVTTIMGQWSLYIL